MTLAPADVDELSALVRDAEARGRRLLVRGHGTRAGPAARPTAAVDDVVSTARIAGVVAHEPGDLTITVRAGTRLADLDAHLAAHGQWLPMPHLAHGDGSVGGWLAVGADSLAAPSAGRARDWVVGACVVHGGGTVARGRGRVVKNVAGYDLPRLVVGSLGTLGVIAEVTLRLVPRPTASATLVARGAPATLDAAARALVDSPWEPTFVDRLDDADGAALFVGLHGRPARVEPLVARVQGLLAETGLEAERLADDADARRLLDEPTRALLLDAPARAAVSLLGLPAGLAARVDDVADAARAAGLVVATVRRVGTHGAVVVVGADDEPAVSGALGGLLDVARRDGAAAVVSSPEPLDAAVVWGPAPPDALLMERVKRALDPRGTFVPGRYVGGL